MGKAKTSFHRKWRWQRVTKLMARDGSNCAICGELLDRHIKDEFSPLYITFDHIVPRAFGGLDLLTNLRLAHATCNQQRGVDPILPADEHSRRAEV